MQKNPLELQESKNSSTRILTIHTNFPPLWMFISVKCITGNKSVLIPRKAYGSTELSTLGTGLLVLSICGSSIYSLRSIDGDTVTVVSSSHIIKMIK